MPRDSSLRGRGLILYARLACTGCGHREWWPLPVKRIVGKWTCPACGNTDCDRSAPPAELTYSLIDRLGL